MGDHRSEGTPNFCWEGFRTVQSQEGKHSPGMALTISGRGPFAHPLVGNPTAERGLQDWPSCPPRGQQARWHRSREGCRTSTEPRVQAGAGTQPCSPSQSSAPRAVLAALPTALPLGLAAGQWGPERRRSLRVSCSTLWPCLSLLKSPPQAASKPGLSEQMFLLLLFFTR